MRKFIFGLLAFCAFCTAAAAQNYAGIAHTPAVAEELRAAGAEVLGQTCGVPLLAVPSQNLAQKAMALAKPGLSMSVVISTTLMANPPLMTAMIAHECAHIDLGHLRADAPQKLTVLQSHNREMEADCVAVRRLRRQGSAEAVQALAAWLEQGRFPVSATHPSSDERLVNLKACAK